MTVTLSPLKPEHAEATYRWVCDAEVADNLGLRHAPSLELTRAWIKQAVMDPHKRAFAIRSDGIHVGNIVLDQIDRYLGTCRLSIYVGEAGRGQGVGRQAVALAAEQAFDELGLNKVWLIVHAHNARAVKAYLAAGFVIEGVLRDEFILRGQRVNALRMGLLASDFQGKHQASATAIADATRL